MLKGFANFSPRLRFGNPGKTIRMFFEDATLKKGCVAVRRIATPSQLLQSCDEINVPPFFFNQGFKASAPNPRGLPARGPRPGLKLANAFSVIFLN
jgi:hypothetical protein